MRLYAATTNPGKLRDFAYAAEGHLLAGQRVEIETLPGLAAIPAAPASTLDERNNAALLRAMDGIPETCRCARYRCVLVLARDGEVVAVAEGSVEGRILTAPRGERGFGYDPLFYFPDLDKTMAELDPGIRLSRSHRGRALRSLLEHFPGV